METDTLCIHNPWTWYAPPPEGGGFCNIFQMVRCRNPLWEGSTRGTNIAASQAVILLSGDNEPKIHIGLHIISPPWIIFVSSTLILSSKYARSVVKLWTWDAPPPDGNFWFWRRRWAQKWIMQSLIWWGGSDRRIGDRTKEEGLGGQGLLLFQIVIWAFQGQFGQEVEQ